MRMACSLFVLATLTLAFAPAPVTTVLLSQNWDAGTGSWTISNSSGTVGWTADGTPAGSPTIGTPYQSAPNSLNYNDGTDYDNGTAPTKGSPGTSTTHSGTATSPPVDLTGTESPTLTFACNYQTETGSDSALSNYDQRALLISNDGFVTTVFSERLGSTGASPLIGDCAAMGTWHTHTIALDPAWGPVHARFSFDTVDSAYNSGAGWFVDDVQVTAITADPPPPEPAPAPASDDEEKGRCGGAVAGSVPGPLGMLVVLIALALTSKAS